MNTKTRILFGLALLATFQGSQAAAQRFGGTWDLQWSIDGLLPGIETGHAIVRHPDLDGDGVPDIVVSAPKADTLAHTDNGVVSAYSGATGLLLWTHDGRSDYEARGYSMALAGDWNGDGLEDIAVGSPFYDPLPMVDAGLVKILDAVTGVDVFTLPGINSGDLFGFALGGNLDYDHDGFPDLLVGAPGADYAGLDSGRTYLYSSSILGLVNTFDGLAAGDLSGFSVSRAGDVDADGRNDFLIGAPYASPGGVLNAGQTLVVSNALATLHAVFSGSTTNGHLGHAVSGGSDLDGDGVGDLILSAPGAAPGGLINAGVVRAMSGATGAQIYRILGANPGSALGIALTLIPDLNVDGVPDLAIAGLEAGKEGFLEFRDGSTGRRFLRLDGAAPGDEFGGSVAVIGDLNGNGSPEVAVGARLEDSMGLVDSGRVHILDFVPCLTSTSPTISSGLGGAVQFHMNFPLSEAGLSYALLGSATGTGPTYFSGVAIPLVNDPLFTQFTSGTPPAGFAGVYGSLDVNGKGIAQVILPSGGGAGLIGNTYWFAAVSLSTPSTPKVSSVAVSLTVVP